MGRIIAGSDPWCFRFKLGKTDDAPAVDLDRRQRRQPPRAHLSLPPAGRGPGLLLVQENFGVNRHIRAVADPYALDGFVVLAPDP
jgi:dienelactone hydrolase